MSTGSIRSGLSRNAKKVINDGSYKKMEFDNLQRRHDDVQAWQ
jgi:hypothetical protein